MILNEVLILMVTFIVLELLSTSRTVTIQDKSSYVAAVVEYNAVGDPLGTDDPVNVLHMNALNYISYIREAASKEVDIIVFPECGLSTVKMPQNRTEIPPFLTQLPDPKDQENPCTNTASETPEVLKILSCAAREAGIYVVINIPEIMYCSEEEDLSCPSDGAFFYNSNVVFDRNGTVIARYRKLNLFGEPAFDAPSVPELITFDTDFGVTFGTFICFDIYFRDPTLTLVQELNVTDVAYPVAWFSEYPFLTATQMQMAWSYAMNVNLLAAGYDYPANRNAGSGIYTGHSGGLEVIMPLNTTNHMLVQRVPKKSSNQQENITITQHSGKELIFFRNPYMSSYTMQLLNLQSNEATNVSLCNRGLCCDFDVKIETAQEFGELPYYRLAVFDGIRGFFGGRTGGIQVCAVVACSDIDVESCGVAPTVQGNVKFDHVNINGKFLGTEDVVVMPNTLYLQTFVPIEANKFSFSTNSELNSQQNVVHMSTLRDIEGIATFGIYARVYNRDGLPVTVVN